jgi:hypothetical protein
LCGPQWPGVNAVAVLRRRKRRSKVRSPPAWAVFHTASHPRVNAQRLRDGHHPLGLVGRHVQRKTGAHVHFNKIKIANNAVGSLVDSQVKLVGDMFGSVLGG